jgi:protein-tyrosine kinase
MSRIEKALEKAVRIRDSKAPGDATSEQAAVRKPPAPRNLSFDRQSLNVESPYIITLNDPASPIAEEYRKLKSMVVKATKLGGFRNTIMITSALGWEGKSITALNFAVTLAQEYDHTVLLVDADLRKPSLHRYFNIVPEAGLADCLLDEADVSEALIKTGIGKLSLLPAGKTVANPVELLSSERMKELVVEMKRRYADRYIVIDTPPVLAFAETHAVSSLIDGVIFVIKEGGASLQHIDNALDILSLDKILGIVYNDAGVVDFDRHYNTGHYFAAQLKPVEGALQG